MDKLWKSHCQSHMSWDIAVIIAFSHRIIVWPVRWGWWSFKMTRLNEIYGWLDHAHILIISIVEVQIALGLTCVCVTTFTVVPSNSICPVFHGTIARIDSVSQCPTHERPLTLCVTGFKHCNGHIIEHLMIRCLIHFALIHMVVTSPRIWYGFSASVKCDTSHYQILCEYLVYHPCSQWWEALIILPVEREISVDVHLITFIILLVPDIVEVPLCIGHGSNNEFSCSQELFYVILVLMFEKVLDEVCHCGRSHSLVAV